MPRPCNMILCSEYTHQFYPTNERAVTCCTCGTDTESLSHKCRYWLKKVNLTKYILLSINRYTGLWLHA